MFLFRKHLEGLALSGSALLPEPEQSLAMFEQLQERLDGVFRNLRGGSRLSEENMADALREIRRALLAADVEVSVAKSFVGRVKERAEGEEVLKSLSAGQQVVKLVHEELVQLLGGQAQEIEFGDRSPAVILVMGLQGSGKTTSSAKLARKLAKEGRKPLMVACDLQRPAAIDQLEILGQEIQVPVHVNRDTKDVRAVAEGALAAAKELGCDTLVVDTAGRLQVDEDLMAELEGLVSYLNPIERLLVLDAMTGQEAVSIAKAFDAKVSITGSVLTKLDGDARGGAALSLVEVTGRPIKLVGMGEKLDALDTFHPERIAGRILGMGDVLSLIEKAQEDIDEDKARAMEEKFRRAEFTLEDFLEQLRQMKKMGSMKSILGMMPGVNSKLLKEANIDERQMARTEAMICSMTHAERRKPELINGSRRKRIARGSGMDVSDVNRLLKQHRDMKKMMKVLNQPGMMKKLGKGLFPGM